MACTAPPPTTTTLKTPNLILVRVFLRRERDEAITVDGGPVGRTRRHGQLAHSFWIDGGSHLSLDDSM